MRAISQALRPPSAGSRIRAVHHNQTKMGATDPQVFYSERHDLIAVNLEHDHRSGRIVHCALNRAADIGLVTQIEMHEAGLDNLRDVQLRYTSRSAAKRFFSRSGDSGAAFIWAHRSAPRVVAERGRTASRRVRNHSGVRYRFGHCVDIFECDAKETRTEAIRG